MRRLSLVRTGMFCRFGSVLERRPVWLPVCTYVVWTRCVRRAMAVSSDSMICRSLVASRCCSSRSRNGCGFISCRSASTAASVEYPVLVLRVFGSCSSSNSTSCSCLGEPRFTSRPIAEYACWASASARSSRSPREGGELLVRDGDAGQLHVGQREQGGQLDIGEHRRDARRRARRAALPVTRRREPRELTGSRALGLGHELGRVGLGQLLIEVAIDEVGEGLVGEARAQQPPGDDGVEREAAERGPRRGAAP